MIPKIIHFVWIGDNIMPDWAERNLAEFEKLNPDYEIKIHGEEILIPALREKYNQITDITSKSDLLRYSALKLFGGWYFDLDFWPFRGIDEIVSAYGIDGHRLFISRQHGQKNSRLEYSNGILAASAECRTLDKIIDYIAADLSPIVRVSYGPQMITNLAAKNKADFLIADWPWFFPCDTKSAPGNYRRMIEGYTDIVYNLAPTGGQKPFAMHLWANGKTDLNKTENENLYFTVNPQSKKLAGILASDLQARLMRENPDHPLLAAANGLAAAGYRVEVRPTGFWPLWYSRPELIIVWNGMRSEFSGTVEKAQLERIPVLRMEHGFYDRTKYFQIDPEGILHWGSWTNQLQSPAPDGAQERFEKVWPNPIKPMRYKKDGYILVLGQVTADTQMSQSEIASGMQLERAVHDATSDLKETIYFRPHPKDKSYVNRRKYLQASPHSNLEEAAAGAKFVIAINSNSCVECLAWGVPVMAFGPATFLQAGVARQTSTLTLRKDIIEILKNGMQPPQQEAVDNYLYHLAARQWHLDEIRQGEVFETMIRGLNE